MSLLGHLNRLESAGLVRIAQLEPDLEYLFRHALVREAAYDSILSMDQKKLHLAVGEAIELLYPDRIDDYAATLSYHFGEAGDEEKALKYCTLAGNDALASFANREAEGHFRCALGLVQQDPERADLLYILGESLYRQSRYPETIQIWQEAIQIYKKQEDFAGVAKCYARSARAAWYGGDQPEGLRLSLEGLEAVHEMDENREKAILIHEAARAYHFNGYPEEARPLCQQALEISERLGAADIQADALTTFGVLPNISPDQAVSSLSRAVEIAETNNLFEIATRANHNMGVVIAEHRGKPKESLVYYLRAADLAQQRGAAHEEIFSLISAASVCLGSGELKTGKEILKRIEQVKSTLVDPSQVELELMGIEFGFKFLSGELMEAIEITRRIRAEARERGDLQMLHNICTNQVDIYLILDLIDKVEDWTEAEEAANEGIKISARGVSSPIQSLCLLSNIYIRQGRLSEARQLYTQALQSAGETPGFWQRQSLLGVERDLARAEGNWGQALEAAEDLSTLLAKSEMRWPWANSLFMWAETHLARGEAMDYERARALYREALAVFVEMGSDFYVDLLEGRLRSLQIKIIAVSQAHDQVTQELAQAGRIQGSFLPEEVPEIDGWEISVTLRPVRDTSGDFYDFIHLPGNRLGIVIADVADKGMAAALFMTTCRTLIRTFAGEHPEQPETALLQVNQRILADTHGGLFITVFYAVLDPISGVIKYCNAGHNPPYLLFADQEVQPQALARTGMPLGILDDVSWEQDMVQLKTGDVLCIYTDGITETQNGAGEFYKEERLLEITLANSGDSAETIQRAVLGDIDNFRGASPRFDDMTFAVIKRL